MLIIYNPTAGRRRVRKLWAVLDVLVAHGVRVELVETERAGHARSIARDAAQDGQDLIVAAGGDGTVAEVAGGMAASGAVSRARLGIIPLGTANVLASELRLPTAPGQIAAMLASGHAVPLWPGLCEAPDGTPRRLFVQMLGVGFDAHVVHNVSRTVKKALGKGAYVLQTLRELPRYPFGPIRFLADGVEYEAGSVIVSKGRLYGGPYELAPEADTASPGFTVVSFERSGLGAALVYGAALPLDMMTRMPGIRRMRASEVAVLSQPGLPAQADGDPAGCTPLRVVDAAGPISVLVGRL